ncbi:UDP-N-acetylmuramoyl-tripeptide--D-alanyl-D-alanine ligase [Candidatus Kuenenbacteria bacterium]|nr:UDP-N-acetylmuramoyl-tripeptide--D-alanyl-D-alanine ligase [Candidatus Kuenenbacteria bacterium]
MKKWLSYHPRYIRSLVYMLQASEYNICDYLNWYGRVKNFNKVECRKHLIKTPKAILIFIIAWTILLSLYSFAISLFWLKLGLIKYIFFAGILLIAPYFLAYVIIAPIILIRIFIQWPIEFVIIKCAQKKLKKHKAIKIAIAGSFGKTTMREILKTILEKNKKVATPLHNHNTPLGISRFIKILKGDEEVLIFELGEYYPGDVKKLCDLTQPNIGIITGINEAHLKKFKSLDKTIKIIFELSDWLKKNPIYVNGENNLARNNVLNDYIIYNRKGIEKWKVENPQTNLKGTSFVISKNGQDYKIKTNLLGLHQIGPLMVAIDIAIKLGISIDQIKEGIKNIKPVDHRLEPKINNAGVITLDDSYNGNPDGVKVVIEFLASLHNYRRFYVTPGLVEMGSKIKEIHKAIGIQLAKTEIEKIILIKNSVTPFIAEGLKDANYNGEIIWFNDALTAFDALPYLTVKNDVVLLQNDWPDQYV